jgi:hypothetical protein
MVKIKSYNRTKDIIFISENVNELRLKDRIEIAKMINHEHLVDKGCGSIVRFSNIENSQLYHIANTIRSKLEFSEKQLNQSLGF